MNKFFLSGVLLLSNLMEAMEVELSSAEMLSDRLCSNGFAFFVKMTNVTTVLGGKEMQLSQMLNLTDEQLSIFYQRVDNLETTRIITKRKLLFKTILNDHWQALQELKKLDKI